MLSALERELAHEEAVRQHQRIVLQAMLHPYAPSVLAELRKRAESTNTLLEETAPLFTEHVDETKVKKDLIRGAKNVWSDIFGDMDSPEMRARIDAACDALAQQAREAKK